MIEHSLHTIFYVLVLIFLIEQRFFKIDSTYLIVISLIAHLIRVFFHSTEETPCNSTVHLLARIIIALRFFMIMSVLLKVDGKTDWDWSTTFWPYWCSFAI